MKIRVVLNVLSYDVLYKEVEDLHIAPNLDSHSASDERGFQFPNLPHEKSLQTCILDLHTLKTQLISLQTALFASVKFFDIHHILFIQLRG